jgi:hypothetical protein
MPPPTENRPAHPDEWGYDLLLYGNEQIIRASDNGVLVAFAAIAFQEIRGGERPAHSDVGFGLLLFSVLLCAVVHFAIGSAYVGRARRLIRGQEETRRAAVFRRAHTTLAWVAGVLQLVCIVVGLLLVLLPQPPEFVRHYLIDPFR